MEESLFYRALRLATSAHSGQVGKAGQPCIEHPKRVASQLADERIRAIALLHDVIEDTSVTLEAITVEFGADIAAEVAALTRRDDETYVEFIHRAAQRPLARQIKIADLREICHDCPK